MSTPEPEHLLGVHDHALAVGARRRFVAEPGSKPGPQASQLHGQWTSGCIGFLRQLPPSAPRASQPRSVVLTSTAPPRPPQRRVGCRLQRPVELQNLATAPPTARQSAPNIESNATTIAKCDTVTAEVVWGNDDDIIVSLAASGVPGSSRTTHTGTGRSIHLHEKKMHIDPKRTFLEVCWGKERGGPKAGEREREREGEEGETAGEIPIHKQACPPPPEIFRGSDEDASETAQYCSWGGR